MYEFTPWKKKDSTGVGQLSEIFSKKVADLRFQLYQLQAVQ